MEADGEPKQLQRDDAEPFLSFCPNFNSYSSSVQCAQIAADVADERPRPSTTLNTLLKKQKRSRTTLASSARFSL
ncbi:hypothetical protein RHGRI_019834 [Rhododendron griersonianum]|uniref:Uncharacterized protein n=1 Tax=Rhododendron griersonianum TaxID=479676 RepID=A0AAV6JE58_9ERIC|nr:hypothetical protein RHGRI_019834 [Rhododendron griersonianum]